MIIRWDHPIDGLTRVDNRFLREAVSELTRAYRRGYHLVIISRRVGDWLLARTDFSRIEMVTIARIRDEYTQNGQAHRSVGRYIDIIPSNDECVEYQDGIIKVSIRSMGSGSIADRAQLLVENEIRDGWMYLFLMNNLCDLYGHRFLSIDVIHGGGDDIVAVAERRFTQPRLILVVVDSDRRTPLTLANPKLSRLKTKIGRSGSPLTIACSPPCREIENLVPLDIICQVPSATDLRANLHLLDIRAEEIKCGAIDAITYSQYFDFKEGLKQEKVRRFNADETRWLLEKLALIQVDENFEDIIGYGDRVIDQIRESNALCAIFREQIRRNDWRDLFGSFIKEMIENFVSNKPIAT